jgi:hypothetical protein
MRADSDAKSHSLFVLTFRIHTEHNTRFCVSIEYRSVLLSDNHATCESGDRPMNDADRYLVVYHRLTVRG